MFYRNHSNSCLKARLTMVLYGPALVFDGLVSTITIGMIGSDLHMKVLEKASFIQTDYMIENRKIQNQKK
jgi:uncharacterized membrane protein